MPRQRKQNGFVKPTGKSPRTWTGYWYEYKIVDGIEKRLQRSKVLGNRADMSKGDAKDKLRTIINQPSPEVPKPEALQSQQTFSTAAERYLHLKRGDWNPKTRRGMASIFKHQILPGIGPMPVSDIKPSDIKSLFVSLASNQETNSESLIKKCLTHTRAVFEMLVEDGILAKNPAKAKMVKMPKTRKPSERYLELHECRALLDVASGRNYMILRLLLGCALRPAELFALRLGDVEPGRLRIDEAAVPCFGVGETKTEESDGYVPMSHDIEAHLRQYIREEGITHPGEFLFASEVGTAMNHDNYLDRILKPLGVAAGIDVYEVTRRRTVKRRGVKTVICKTVKTSHLNHQILRRTVATHLQNYGTVKDAQGLLRHGDAATTLRYYQKVMEEGVSTSHAGWDVALNASVQ